MARKSKGKYPVNWWDIALEVKEEAGWCCVRCGHPHEVESGYILTVHHLDLDKSNCAWWNLVALCQRCHLRIQGKVVMERVWILDHSPWFVPYVAGYYASLLGLGLSRDEVLSDPKKIIDLYLWGTQEDLESFTTAL